MGNTLINSVGGAYQSGVKLSCRAVIDIVESYLDMKDNADFTMKKVAFVAKVSEPP